MFSCTCTHTSCYVMVIFSCTCSHTSCYVMVIFSCTCSHTSCYAMVIFSCTCTYTHVMRTIFLQMETVLGSHMPKVWKSNMPKCLIKTKNGPNKCEEPLFFPVHCGRDANRWQMVERPERLYSQKLSKTVVPWSQHKRAPWIGKVCLGLLLAKIFGTIDTSPVSRRTLQGRQSNEALLRRRKKVLHPKKTRTYVKKRSSFGDFQNPIFHVNMRKNDVSL